MGNRDAVGMARLADELLGQNAGTPRNRQLYLLIAGMTGNIAQDRRAQSLELWEKFSPQMLKNAEPSLLLQLLYAHSLRQA